jgi:D-erythrulose 4-phosphate isomerase
MKIALGADSAGKPLLDVVAAHLRAKSDHVVNDLSGLGYYAEIADRVASSVQAGEHDRAILFCGCACRKSNPNILMMQSAEDWAAKNVASSLNAA